MSNDLEGRRLGTRLSHVSRSPKSQAGIVNPPVWRGSTVLLPTCAERRASGGKRLEQAWTYGIHGLPTHHALEDAVAMVEGGDRTAIQGSGLSAIVVAMFAFLKNGDHVLMTDGCYGPARRLCETMLKDFGVSTTYYRPQSTEAEVKALMKPNTKVVYTEAPSSVTFEMQDIPAIARAAHAGGAKLLMDNTWGIMNFQPFEKGVDVSIQALTKYVGGHSDILMGSVTTRNADWAAVKNAQITLGQYASPDDCFLALRGIRTLKIRLEQQQQHGLAVARWLQSRPEVARVLYPALPEDPGHAIWKRDFSGACSLFGVVLKPAYTQAQVDAVIDDLALFGIGASWGGYESLAQPVAEITRSVTGTDLGGPAMRLHIGLEDPADLIADLDQAMSKNLRA